MICVDNARRIPHVDKMESTAKLAREIVFLMVIHITKHENSEAGSALAFHSIASPVKNVCLTDKVLCKE